MKTLFESPDFHIGVGFAISRWYLGVGYESPRPEVRAFVFRLGPFYLQFMHRLDD